MQVYVDESGDTGMNGDASASSYFVVTAVIFENPQEAAKCSQCLEELKNELGLQVTDEFKFNKLNLKSRMQFLKVAALFNFKYCTVILDKKKLDGRGFKFHKSFYKFPIRLLFKNAKRFLRNATICVDKSGNQEFSDELEKYLKVRINTSSSSPAIRELRMEDSASDNLLQLADVICGAIGRSLKADKSDHRKYRPLIIDKEAGIQMWPKRRRKNQIKTPSVRSKLVANL